MIEKTWDQLDLEYRDIQLKQSTKHHLKMNQYLHCCFRIYLLRLAQSVKSVDCFELVRPSGKKSQ